MEILGNNAWQLHIMHIQSSPIQRPMSDTVHVWCWDVTVGDSWWQLFDDVVVTHVYPVENGVSPIATLSCWSLMFLTSTMLELGKWEKWEIVTDLRKMDDRGDLEGVLPDPVECGAWVCQGRGESALKNHIVSFHHILHWVWRTTGDPCKIRVRTGI